MALRRVGPDGGHDSRGWHHALDGQQSEHDGLESDGESATVVDCREWTAEFECCKQFPEWQQQKSMTLSEFQCIHAWEHGHCMLGRVVGVAFAVLWWLHLMVHGRIPADTLQA